MTSDRSRDPSAFLARTKTAAGASARRPWTVAALTSRLRACIDANFGRVAVLGEVSDLKRASSGHVYFTLKDRAARLEAVVWKSNAARALPRDLRAGVEVVCFGALDVYAPRGSYSLICDRVEIAGRGDFHARFEELKERLRAEGLFADARKRPLPFLPRGIGVVTSPEGAALHDFLTTLQRRFPRPVVIAPVRVQGEGSAAEIARAIRALARHRALDVLVVTRGGGSLEDLWSFNEEIVARAIAASPLPVVSAVGHETDVTVADFVADRRAKTPTDAAVLVVPAREELIENLRHARVRLGRAVQVRLERRGRHLAALAAGRAMAFPLQRIQRARRELAHDATRLIRGLAIRMRQLARELREREERLQRAAPRRRLDHRAEDLRRLALRLAPAVARQVDRHERELARHGALLDAHSPLRTMARGYSVVRRADEERPVTSLAQLATGDALEILLRDGTAAVRVEECRPRPPLVDVEEARPPHRGGDVP